MKNYIAATILLCLFSQSAAAELFGEWPAGGGKITVTPTGRTVRVSGIRFAAEPGVLTQGSSAAPFTSFIPDFANPGNVTFGVLGAKVTIEGPVELDVAVSATAGPGDVVGTFGNGLPFAFPVVSVPEPAGLSLASVGFVGLLAMRQRR